ncbi:hypothetical protein [Paenibacillus polysaccharolyticus]|uniref:hypothetical protein n=1 Tax=Paenibacillus polysaccharolyticus TaxID=582692 RepID=UPI00280BC1FB|nr:hypothetical protein [Paenibacillus polysaccharolyticus]
MSIGTKISLIVISKREFSASRGVCTRATQVCGADQGVRSDVSDVSAELQAFPETF